MTTSSIKNFIIINSAMVVANTSIITLVLKINNNPNSNIIDDYFFNCGLLLVLIGLPILSMFAYLYSRIDSDPEEYSTFKTRLKYINFFNFLLIISNLIGFVLVLNPFKLHINGAEYSYSFVLAFGLITSIFLIIAIYYFLKRGIKKDVNGIE